MASPTAQISVGLMLDLQNKAKVMKELSKSVQDAFTVDTSTTFGKNLTKTVGKIEKELLNIDALTGKDFFSETDMDGTVRSLSKIANLFSELNVQVQNASVGNLGLEDDERWKNINSQIQTLMENIKKLKSASVASVWGEDDPRLAQFGKDAKKTGFNAGKNFDANIRTMTQKQGEYTAKYAAMEEQAQDATIVLNNLNEAQRRISEFSETDIKHGQEIDERIAINNRVAAAVRSAGWIGGRTGRTAEEVRMGQGAALRDNILNDVGTGYREGGKEFAKVVASWLELDDASVTNNARETWDKIYSAFEKEAEKAQNGKPGLHNFGIGSLYSKAKNTLKGDYSADSHLSPQVFAAREASQQLEAAETAWNELPVESRQALENLQQTQALIDRLTAQLEELKKARQEYMDLIDNNEGQQLHDAEAERKRLSQEITAPVKDTVRNIKDQSVRTNVEGNAIKGSYYDAKARAAEEVKAQKELEKEHAAFQANLKSSISRWMNAAQIVSLIKNGVREAYQDIQNLDKAMTNIAVVTDMSVSDLWGQINEYMSIAQKYGVTTQGVYEVSQLFYQQGLDAADTMAATTETLKMARQQSHL